MNLLRLEGVNLDATAFDTDDLSTRRGSSLLLLQAVRDVAEQFSQELTPISTGASVGLFTVKDSATPGLPERVSTWLQGHSNYRHMTFVVSTAEAKGFKPAVEAAITANRWQQMQCFSVSLADLDLAGRQGACSANAVRPASPGDKDRYSPSVRARRNHGGGQKQSFYRRELDELTKPPEGPGRGASPVKLSELPPLQLLKQLDFVHDLQELTDGLDPAWGYGSNLNGKMAVFYADGNRFGQIAAECAGEKPLAEWDVHLKNLRRTWLASLLELTRTTRHWQTKEGTIRLETLLWGGDELMMVAPAWCGLELALHFQQASVHWQHAGKPLTHACGLVLCHAKAPIGPISDLARSLADLGKEQTRDATTLHALTLESFDSAGGHLGALLETRFPGHNMGWDKLTLNTERLSAITTQLPQLKDLLPRSTLVRSLRLLLQNEVDHDLLKRSYASVHKAVKGHADERQDNKSPGTLAAWQTLWRALSGLEWPDTAPPDPDEAHLAAWAQILEFWDYVPLTPTAARQSTPTTEAA